MNKISKADQKEYLHKMKHRSYESEIEIKWVGAGYIVYKNVHLIKLPECEEKRGKRGRDNNVETRKKKYLLVLLKLMRRVRKLNEASGVLGNLLP